MGRNSAIIIALVLVSFCQTSASDHREKGYLYLSPIPGAEFTSRDTKFVLVRFGNISPYDVTNLYDFVQVVGSASGVHSGDTRIASDGRTVVFEMWSRFSSNELVTVNLSPAVNPQAVGEVEECQYQFMISGPMVKSIPETFVGDSDSGLEASGHIADTQAMVKSQDEISVRDTDAIPSDKDAPAKASGQAVIMENGVSVPSDFPAVDVTVNNNPAPGYIFIDYSGGDTKYAMILENSGAPVWYRQGVTARNFQVERNGMITWHRFVGFDQNFNQVQTFNAVNGYETDNHELQVLENGHYLLFGLRSHTVDVSRFVPGGKPAATVRETALHEFTPDGELIFQWRAWDNYDIRMMEHWSYDDKPTSQTIRFVHMNAIDVDNDGHLLVSSKRVSEVTKINRDTGEVIWRLGGQHPTDPSQDRYRDERLTILDDPLGQFNVQHDIRVVGENRYTVFDNHWLNRSPNSRAVEYEVDPDARTARWVWQYQEEPPHESHHMGNAQRLPNGNTLINWVETDLPKATEVRPDGTKVYEMNWAARNSKSYRVFRFPWEGKVDAPYLIVESQADNITLIFNKFGDPGVAYYRIYGGTTPAPTTLLETSVSTLKRMTNLENAERYYFRVTAVDADGRESSYSNEESVPVNFAESYGNMVLNGAFSLGKAWWTGEVAGSASAQWNIESGACRFDITNGGSQFSDVQLSQDSMQMIEGKEYVLEFDAWSDIPRLIEARVGQADPSGTDYSRIGYVSITPNRTAYRYSFTMQDASDHGASVMFGMGLYNVGVYLDNISLRMNRPDAEEHPTIALVSDCKVPGAEPPDNHGDDELIAWLESLGFDVDMTCMNSACVDNKSPFGNRAIVSALENADLVLMSRRAFSGDYDGNAGNWNALDTPLLLCTGYLTRNTRWHWTACESSDANPPSSTDMTIEFGRENHPFLARLTGPVQLFDWSTAPIPDAWPKTVFLPDCDFAAGSTVIGRYGDTTRLPILADIPAGTILANGNIAGQRRVFFGHWSYNDDLGPPFNREANWDDFITPQYKTILRNILNEVLGLVPGDFDFDGCVQADDLFILADQWLAEQSGLWADLDDNGKVDYCDFAILAEQYINSCP